MIGLSPTGGYSRNNRYSIKAVMWFLHMGVTDGVQIMHCRKGHEYTLPELPRLNVDVYCPETNTVYEFFGHSGMSPPRAAIPRPNDMKAPCRV